MVGRIIRSDECVAEGAAYLAQLDARFSKVLLLVSPLPLRLKNDGFEALLSAIVSQKISVASASAIWRRMKKARLVGPRKIMWARDAELRACGLSSQKIRYARALASSGIDYRHLRNMKTGEVISTLTDVTGIGPWTADIYAMFSLGRADVFAPGDLALQEAARLLFDLDKRPSEKEMARMAKEWSPWRSVAARLLWAYYRFEKNREGLR